MRRLIQTLGGVAITNNGIIMKLKYLGLCLALSGCSTIGTPEMLMNKNQSIQEFVYNNFSEGPEKWLWDENKTMKMTQGVVFTAPYNGINSSSLTRPLNDITKFCRLSGGNIKNINKNNDISVVSKFYQSQGFKSPTQSMMEGQAFARSKGASPEMAQKTGMQAMLNQIEANHGLHAKDVQEATSVITESINNGNFGLFTCSAANNDILWLAEIGIEAMASGNLSTNLLDNPKATIRVRGWKQ